MKDIAFVSAAAAGMAAIVARAAVLPHPAIVVADLRSDEKPVAVETLSETLETDGLYSRIRATMTFTNPNRRDFAGELEFPLPDGATVCGYHLEVNGTMVPGVVVGKEKARVAFETEKAKGVDPGIVEHVKGNVWRTRIFPLRPGTPRKAAVDYIVPVAEPVQGAVYEQDGGDVFVGEAVASGSAAPDVAALCAAFAKGTILWDASSSAEQFRGAWRARLEALPETGSWTLAVFRNDVEMRDFQERAALLAAVDAIEYDGGTDIGAALAAAGEGPMLLFTDEVDTLGLVAPQYEDRADLVVASRAAPAARAISVRRLPKGETPPEGAEVKIGRLLATAWAANRIVDLASQADARKDEFLELGRKYGVASDVTSLIVLETLEQYLTHKIEPPKELSFHDEWVARRAAQDDEIGRREEDADYERGLLRLWKERVEWWLNPVPPKNTPKSWLFDGVVSVRDDEQPESAVGARWLRTNARARRSANEEECDGATAAGCAAPEFGAAVHAERMVAMEAPGAVKAKDDLDESLAGGGGATITLKAWTSDAPYLKEIEKADDAYAAYLKQKKAYGASPAFFMDVASLFFGRGETARAVRIIGNMAEFKLEDAAIWRSMGWRLREAGELEAAIRCFRHALRLRGEEGQSRRDLALVLAERGKSLAARDAPAARAALEEAAELFKAAAFTNWARRSARRSNDMQVGIIALEELNALISWCEAVEWPDGTKPAMPSIDSAYRRDLPLKIRIVLSWDADETDIDIHVLEPDGEEAYYGHRRTGSGGFVGEDVTTGYGPEEYLRKEGKGVFKVLANYFASHQTKLTGAVNATATVYTDWGTAAEQMKVLTLRLDKPKSKHLVGEIAVGN